MGITINNKTKEIRTAQVPVQVQIQIQEEEPLLLCPKCLCRIPFINLNRNGHVIQVHIKCLKCGNSSAMKLDAYLSSMKQRSEPNHYCSYENTHSSSKATKYCVHCRKWLCSICIKTHESSPEVTEHRLLSNEIEIPTSCPIHDNQPYIGFCQDCNGFICSKCNEETHSSHKACTFESISDDIKTFDMRSQVQLIEYFRETVKKKKETIISLLDSKIEQINQLKQNLESAYVGNDGINKMILELLMAFKHNHALLKDVTLYEAMENIKANWVVNNTEAMIQDNNIESNCLEFIKYLNTNFIVRIGTESKMEAMNTEQQKINGNSIREIDDSNNKIQLSQDINEIKTIENEQGGQEKRVKSSEAKQKNHQKERDQKKQKTEIIDDIDNLMQSPTDYKCIKTIDAHTDGINAMIQLFDSRIATASYDKSIKVWRAKVYTCDKELIDHTDEIYALIQLKDTRLCSGSRDATVKIWDINTYQCTHTLTDHTNSIVTLLQLHDGCLASGSADKTVRIWHTTTFECCHTLTAHTDTVYCLIELHDTRLVSGSNDTSIKIWNGTSSNMTCGGTLTGHTDFVNCLLQINATQLLSGSSDYSVILWDITKLSRISAFKNNQTPIFTLLLLNNNEILIGTKKNILILNMTNFTLTKTIQEHKNGIRVFIQLKNNQLASCSDDHTFKIWEH